MVYAGLLDLQALMGVASFIYLLTSTGASLLTSNFILHPILMILALIVVHASRKRRSGPVPARHRARLVAHGLGLVLAFAGRMILAWWASACRLSSLDFRIPGRIRKSSRSKDPPLARCVLWCFGYRPSAAPRI